MRTVLILSFSPLTRDPRILRQIGALADGYQVVTCGYGPAPDGVVKHVEIPEELISRPAGFVGIAALAVRAHRLAKRSVPSARAAESLLGSVEFDLIVANDVEAVPVALRVAAGRPVVADLHEYAPGQSGDWRVRTLLLPHKAAVCKTDVPKASAVTTVAPGIADEYQRRFDFSSRVVLNAPRFRAPQPKPIGTPIRLVHHGVAGRGRVLERMIHGVGGLESLTLDMYLVKMADDPSYLEELLALADRFANVSIHPPVPFPEIPKMLDEYDAGLYLLPPESFNNLHALPNKFFEFIQSGLPVIVGPSPEMAALVQKHDLGLVLPDWEVDTLRQALESLSPEQIADWQTSVCTAAEELSGEVSAEVIREVVEAAFRPTRPEPE